MGKYLAGTTQDSLVTRILISALKTDAKIGGLMAPHDQSGQTGAFKSLI